MEQATKKGKFEEWTTCTRNLDLLYLFTEALHYFFTGGYIFIHTSTIFNRRQLISVVNQTCSNVDESFR